MLRIVSTILRPYEPLNIFFCEDPFINKNDFVIVESPKGLIITQVMTFLKKLPDNIEHTSIPTIIRKATEEDINSIKKNKKTSQSAYEFCKQCIHKHSLEMKLVDVELTFDKSKFIFYFTAPTRIDFRNLIKDLVQEYHVRIEMRQVGERNETQLIGSIGSCGMVCCCRRFLKNFTPVSIKMAKEQNIFLNPSKISGQCGKLLCCLSYEQETYHDFYKKTPSVGKKYNTSQGVMKVIRTNIFHNSITALNTNNEEIEFNISTWEELSPTPIVLKNNQNTEVSKKSLKNHIDLLIEDDYSNNEYFPESLTE